MRGHGQQFSGRHRAAKTSDVDDIPTYCRSQLTARAHHSGTSVEDGRAPFGSVVERLRKEESSDHRARLKDRELGELAVAVETLQQQC